MEQAVIRNLIIICICLCTFGYLSLNYTIKADKVGIADPTPLPQVKRDSDAPKVKIENQENKWVAADNFIKSEYEIHKLKLALNSLKKENASKNGLLNFMKEKINSNEYIEFYPNNVKLTDLKNLKFYNINIDFEKDLYINNTNFRIENGSPATIDINFRYEKKIIKSNKEYEDDKLYENINLGVKFIQKNVFYKDYLNFPMNIAITGNHLEKNYICSKIEDAFINMGQTYVIEYSCPELPNIYDYKEKMRIELIR